MVSLLKKFWAAIGLAAFFFGLFWLPKDVQDYSDAMQPWRKLLAMVDQLIAFQVLAGALVLWVIWSDVRPFVQKWLNRKISSPIVVVDGVYCETRRIKNSDYFLNYYYLLVGPQSDATLRRVQGRIFHMGKPLLMPIKGLAEPATDIRHGEWQFFLLGRIATTDIRGRYEGGGQEVGNQLEAYQHNLPRNFITFELPANNDGQSSHLGHFPENPAIWKLGIVLSADNIIARQIRVDVDLSQSKQNVTWMELEAVAPA